ncbi:YcnI family protein [Frondihabitans sp. 4ASC-45]|uniref:YcnI family copper-binding membrane protein n=1 Tax=Frondihabitans sp. 4ASC-45 TaxID=3111636 RepID=UPI003C284CCB
MPTTRTRTRTLALRTAFALPLAGALALAAPLAASAHVHVEGDDVTAGSYSTLQFKVPTESATASTTRVAVDFPTDHPFTSVSYQPLAGWKAVVTTSTLPKAVKTDDGTITKAVTRVTWTADSTADGIAPGEFQLFTVSAGAVPDVDEVELPTTQTYSDGSVVKWNEPTPADGEEPEHPAPVLAIGAATESHHGGVTATDTATATPVASASTGTTSGLGLGFGIAGLGLGALALVVALLAYVRSARGSARS